MRQVHGVDEREVAEVIRPVLVPTTEHAPPRSVVCDMAYAKLLSRILSVVVTGAGSKAAPRVATREQAIALSAGGHGTGTMWTAMRKSSTEVLSNAQWRTTIALWLGLGARWLVDVPCVFCAKATKGICVSVPWRKTHTTLFAARLEVLGPDRIVRSCAHCED